MEYYAKSPVFILKEEEKKKISEKLEEAIRIFQLASDTEICQLLLKYKSKLQKTLIHTEHKTLQAHLKETVQCANSFFEIYGNYFSDKEKQLILEACRLHDIGKANDIFQAKVNPALKKINKEQIPHGFLSAMLLSESDFLKEHKECGPDDFSILLTAIYFHHTRSDRFDAKEMQTYCEQFYLKCVREYLQDEEVTVHLSNRNALLFSEKKEKGFLAIDEDLWCTYMLVKGMLNKFDWTVSAGYENAEIAPDMMEKKLCQNISAALEGNFRLAQQCMMQNRERSVVMIAPTGTGKTEAALLWLNGEKGFYTLPLKVSSNAIYERIKEKYAYENVSLLHSDSLNSYLKTAEDLEDGYRNYEQAKLFCSPLTVCTVDQLFRFVYKALGTEIFAATLKYSKIVIDEIQSYSPRIVAALILGLSEIQRMGGKFAIITATFPPVLRYFMKKNGLLEHRDYVFHDFSSSASVARHRIAMIDGDFNTDEIIKEARQKKVLIICNTVSKAQKVYAMLKEEGIEPGLLHSRFIREHRSILEKNIIRFSLDKTQNGIWITTQIVEASLDIDFDLLYTEMCTADSLLQRMGRCNRAGKKDTSQPNVRIFVNESGRGTVYDKDIYDRSIKLLRKCDGMLLTETAKIEYINEVYDMKQIQKTNYFRQIEENIAYFKQLLPAEYDAKTAQIEFRAIQSISVIPETIYEQNYEMIQSMQELLEMPHIDKSIRKSLKDKLAGMTLSLNIKFGIPDGIDNSTIGKFDIHRTRLKYDFYGNTGLGLVLDKVEDEDNFI